MIERFERRARYRTPYGTARAIETWLRGAGATLRIIEPSPAAERMGWKPCHLFTAHVDDQVEPSPKTWERIA